MIQSHAARSQIFSKRFQISHSGVVSPRHSLIKVDQRPLARLIHVVQPVEYAKLIPYRLFADGC